MKKIYLLLSMLCLVGTGMRAQTVVEVSPETPLSEAVAGKDVTNLKITGRLSQSDIGTLHKLAVQKLDVSELKYVTVEGDPGSDESIRYYYYFDEKQGDWFAIQNDTELPACLCVGMTSLKEVTLPAQARELYRFVFDGCTSLETVNGIDHITRFHPGSMRGTAIKEITFSPDLTLIEWSVFQNCFNLTKLNNFENTELEEIQDNAFLKCNLVGTLKFPSTIRRIGNWGFGMDWDGWNDKLTALDFSQATQLESIGACVFAHLNGLKEVVLPNSLYSIGGSAFNGCQAITRIVLPQNPAFNVIYDSFVTGASGLTEIDIPASVEVIQHEAFNGAKLKKITFHGKKCPYFSDDVDGSQNYKEYAAGQTPFNAADPDETIVVFADQADSYEAAETYRESDFVYPYLTTAITEGDVPEVEKQYCDAFANLTVDEGWNVFVFPFSFKASILKGDLEADIIGTLRGFDKDAGAIDVAESADDDVLPANTPVFIKTAVAISNADDIQLQNICIKVGDVHSAKAGNVLAFGSIESATATDVYVPAGDVFEHADSYETPGFHGWLTYNIPEGVQAIRLTRTDGTVYTLGGLRQARAKGIVIQDGKKVIR